MLNFSTYKSKPLQFEEAVMGRNIVVGNYETRNFDFCPAATEAFSNYDIEGADVDTVNQLEHAANEVDLMLGVERKAVKKGFANEEEASDFFIHLDRAEEILDDMGVLEDHDYLREVHEPRFIDLMDVDVDDADLDADEEDLDADDVFDDDFDIEDEEEDDEEV